MIDIYSLWLDFVSALNLSQNGWFRPDTDFLRAVNEISIRLWNKWTGQAEKSQEEKDKLFPFLKSLNIAVSSAGAYYGIAKKPKDYGRLASVRIVVHTSGTTCPDKNIDEGKCDGFETKEEFEDKYLDNVTEYTARIIDNQKWGAFCEHKTKGPKLDNPGITQVNDSFKVAPRKVSVIALDYYVEPTPATFKYTVVAGNPQTGAGDQLVYDTTSTKLQWPEQMRNEFIEELKKWYTLYIRDQIGNQINLSQKQVPV